ncbi:MAG: hypothetical protein PHV99_02170 [Candidatus Pacebacteria bacterium]|nr:hypothetical protein [Candidatus Paceibacterota bacterium]
MTLAPFEAIAELERRQKDPEIKKKVEKYLAGDIPEYFKDGPILCLARHIITPNFETLRFVHLTWQLGMKPVITQDSKGMFVPFNQVKKALCKLPVCRRLSQKKGTLHEHYENVTIVDFNKADGKPFSEIETLWGEKLTDFHMRLFSEFIDKEIDLPDDAAWIDRHHRDNLLEHYKHLLALFVAHGIFFENYDMNDPHEVHFVRHILRPAFRFVEKKFGYRPLIVQVFPTSFESTRFWISYPKRVLDIVRESMHKQG